MSGPIETGTALLHSLNIEKFYAIAPLSITVVILILLGAFIAWYFMKEHIRSLKDFIEYLKQDKK